MIPLTTKLPAICYLLRRVLEMEEKATPGPWKVVQSTLVKGEGAYGTMRILNCDSFEGSDTDPHNADFISFSRNITKPQATALLASIEAHQFIETLPTGQEASPDQCSAVCRSMDALQSIADAFPDALFQDSSRCA